jgi:hypothetical protein
VEWNKDAKSCARECLCMSLVCLSVDCCANLRLSCVPGGFYFFISEQRAFSQGDEGRETGCQAYSCIYIYEESTSIRNFSSGNLEERPSRLLLRSPSVCSSLCLSHCHFFVSPRSERNCINIIIVIVPRRRRRTPPPRKELT